MIALYLAPAVALVMTVALMPLVIAIATRFGWYDRIDDRKVHTGEIPRLGGVAMYLALAGASAVLLLCDPDLVSSRIDYRLVFAGLTLFFLLGVIDDFANVHGLLKLAVQVGAAGLLVGGGAIVPVGSMGWSATPFVQTAATVLSIGWLVFAANAVNLSDGMDGLAGTISLGAAASLAAIGLVGGAFLPAAVALVVSGVVLGFLLFNAPPARVFMGDGGSLLLGAATATLPLILAQHAGAAPARSVLIAPLLLAVPVGDTVAAIVRRTRAGLPFWRPDRRHLHHVLMASGLSVRRILFVVGSVSLTAGLIAISIVARAPAFIFLLTLIPAVAGVAGVWYTFRRTCVARTAERSHLSTRSEELLS